MEEREGRGGWGLGARETSYRLEAKGFWGLETGNRGLGAGCFNLRKILQPVTYFLHPAPSPQYPAPRPQRPAFFFPDKISTPAILSEKKDSTRRAGAPYSPLVQAVRLFRDCPSI